MKRFAIPLLLTGALALPAIGLLASRRVPVDPPEGRTAPKVHDRTPELTGDRAEALQIANMLDGIVQPRFYVEAGAFGLSRLAPLISGHESASRVMLTVPKNNGNDTGAATLQTSQASIVRSRYGLTEHDMEVLKAVRAQNRDYQVGFLHTTHVPGRQRFQMTAQGGARTAPQEARKIDTTLDTMYDSETNVASFWRKAPRKDDVFEESLKAMPTLEQGKPAEVETKTRYVFLRPVTASKETCVKCHEGSKPGDCLGVMVYVVNKSLKVASR